MFLKYLLLISFLLIPISVSAAENVSGLVACSGGDACNFCSFVETANTLIDWVIVVTTTLTVLLLAFAGFRMITSAGDASALEYAKKLLVNSFIGILIMLGGWTLVDTGLKLFAGGDLGVWNAVECGGAFESAPASQYGITLEVTDGIDINTVEEFVADHGDGSIDADPMLGSGGNCPGASASQVVAIPGESNKFLRSDAARNFIAMREAASADGVTLRIASAWRSQATQEEIWNRHNCDLVNCSGVVARPCSKGGNGSNHNGGVAVDIVGSQRGTKIFNWLKTNGGRYNFYNNLGPDDPVHWSPTGR